MGRKLRKNFRKVRSKQKKNLNSRSSSCGLIKKMSDESINLNDLPEPISASNNEAFIISDDLPVLNLPVTNSEGKLTGHLP